jgi:hypothetical protein
MHKQFCKHICDFCAFLWLTSVIAQAQPAKTPLLPPEKVSPVSIPRFESAPVIDGRLDDDT